jgi:hypothetical protein
VLILVADRHGYELEHQHHVTPWQKQQQQRQRWVAMAAAAQIAASGL